MATVKKAPVIIPAIPRIFEKQQPKVQKEPETTKSSETKKDEAAHDHAKSTSVATTEKAHDEVNSAVKAELPVATSSTQISASEPALQAAQPAPTSAQDNVSAAPASETALAVAEPTISEVTPKAIEPTSVVEPSTPIRASGRVELSKPEWLPSTANKNIVFGSNEPTTTAVAAAEPTRTAEPLVLDSPSSSNSAYAGSTQNSDDNGTGSRTSISESAVNNTPKEKEEAPIFPDIKSAVSEEHNYTSVGSAKTSTAHNEYRGPPAPIPMMPTRSHQSHQMMPSFSHHSHARSFNRRESHEQMSNFTGHSSPGPAPRMDVEFLAAFTSYTASLYHDSTTADCLVRIELQNGTIDIPIHSILFAQHPYNRELIMKVPQDGALKTLRFSDTSGFVTEHAVRAAIRTFYGVTPRVYLDQQFHHNGSLDVQSTLSFLAASYLMHSDAAIHASLHQISTLATIQQVPPLLEFVVDGPPPPPCLATDNIFIQVQGYLFSRSTSAMAAEVYNIAKNFLIPSIARSFRIDTSAPHIPSLGGFPPVHPSDRPAHTFATIVTSILVSLPFVLLRDFLWCKGDRILAIEVLREREARRRAAKTNGAGGANVFVKELVAVSDNYMAFWSDVEEK